MCLFWLTPTYPPKAAPVWKPAVAEPIPPLTGTLLRKPPPPTPPHSHCCAKLAAALGTRPAGFRTRLRAEPGELAVLDALSWLPEGVAMAARRGRPDEFAGYLEELAARTIDSMDTTGFTAISSISSERLCLADAARTALAAGLGLLGISAPGRL